MMRWRWSDKQVADAAVQREALAAQGRAVAKETAQRFDEPCCVFEWRTWHLAKPTRLPSTGRDATARRNYYASFGNSQKCEHRSFATMDIAEADNDQFRDCSINKTGVEHGAETSLAMALSNNKLHKGSVNGWYRIAKYS
jgi:hypothetical protein